MAGETGTGKELFARAIHDASPRAASRFVPVNCGSLPDTLFEDELFGHHRGAFTDARTRRSGLLAQAEGGTLFLDEVEALTPRAQVALLRVLQEKTIRPLGSDVEHRIDVRFVAATNVSLEQLVREKTFRADLHYRLAVLCLRLPALRERRDDIEDLACHFVAKHSPPGRPAPRLSPAALLAMRTMDWPGNVRELENAVIRGIWLARGGVIELEDMGLAANADAPRAAAPATAGPFKELKRQIIHAFEREYLIGLMAMHGGNVTRAAKTARKERRELGRLLKKHQLSPQDFSGLRSS
jgi:DNA-binding NtrC family response regulator